MATGDAKIYYTPTQGKGLETITLPGGANAWSVVPVAAGRRVRTGGGVIYPQEPGAWERLTFRYREFVDRDLYVALRHLERHLQAGGLCGVAARQEKAWAGFVASPIVRGQTLLQTAGDQFYAGLDSAALAADDELVIVSGVGEALIDSQVVSSVSNSRSITLTRGMRSSMAATPILVRHGEFFPLGGLPEEHDGRILLDHDDRNLVWTLELVLDAAVGRTTAQGFRPGMDWDVSTGGRPGKADGFTRFPSGRAGGRPSTTMTRG